MYTWDIFWSSSISVYHLPPLVVLHHQSFFSTAHVSSINTTNVTPSWRGRVYLPSKFNYPYEFDKHYLTPLVYFCFSTSLFSFSFSYYLWRWFSCIWCIRFVPYVSWHVSSTLTRCTQASPRCWFKLIKL